MYSSHGIPSCPCLLIAAERYNASPFLFPFFFLKKKAFSNIRYLEIGTLENASVSKLLFLVYVVLKKKCFIHTLP